MAICRKEGREGILSEQHNHHCIMTAGGEDWIIIESIPGHLKLYQQVDAIFGRVMWIDITKVRWEEYNKAAVENDYAREYYAKG